MMAAVAAMARIVITARAPSASRSGPRSLGHTAQRLLQIRPKECSPRCCRRSRVRTGRNQTSQFTRRDEVVAHSPHLVNNVDQIGAAEEWMIKEACHRVADR